MSLIGTTVRRLRSDPRLVKLPPYLSLLCILGGIFWLFLLPLNRYSRNTYISENALLPGQVHTYFAGSEQNIFRGYREELRSTTNEPAEEVAAALYDSGGNLSKGLNTGRIGKIQTIFHSTGLPTATQYFEYSSTGSLFNGTNIYSVLRAPRGDGTEAIVLLAPQSNVAGEDNTRGVALLLTLARYFKRWSLWSKDIIFLVTPNVDSGPQAWISAYHSTHDHETVASLPLKSGALQGALCIDLPLDRQFETISVSYDGINGQLPNLDLVNTAVSVASGQMRIGTSIQSMHQHDDSYRARLTTMLRGMSNQAIGLGTGAHSVFMQYHIDAITLTATGHGWQDEMALGRTVEGVCRSLNNLLEHFHQSFFFYLLMHTNRFVSIGTYLPSAMAVAAGFTIMAIYLWVQSGYVELQKSADMGRDIAVKSGLENKTNRPQYATNERQLFKPIALVASAHLVGLAPLYVFNHTIFNFTQVQSTLACSLLVLVIPSTASRLLTPLPTPTYQLSRSLSILLLGLFLSTLTTLNFSLSLVLGLLCLPVLTISRGRHHLDHFSRMFLLFISPPGLVLVLLQYSDSTLTPFLNESRPLWRPTLPPTNPTLSRIAFGWNVMGSWGVGVAVCLVWLPAWITALSLGLTKSSKP